MSLNYKRPGKVPISPVTVLPYRLRIINFFNYLLMSFSNRKKEPSPNNRALVLLPNGLFNRSRNKHEKHGEGPAVASLMNAGIAPFI